MNRNC